MKLLIRNVLIALGLLPMVAMADVFEEQRPQTAEEQTWEAIDRWIDDGEKESLLSDYYQTFEQVNTSSTSLSLTNTQAVTQTFPDRLSVISTSPATSSTSMEIISSTSMQHGSVSIVTPATPSKVSIISTARATTFVTTTDKVMSIMSEHTTMTIMMRSGKKVTIPAGQYYTIPANTTVKIVTTSATTLITNSATVKSLFKVISSSKATINVSTLSTHAIITKVKASNSVNTSIKTSHASQVTTNVYAPKASLAMPTVFSKMFIEETHYAPQLNLSGFYGSNGGSYGEADVWLPVWQTWNKIFYADIRGQKDTASAWDGAAGLGYRWLSDDVDYLYDVHAYYNTYHSTYNNQYQQVMLGGRFRTEHWTLRGDYYYSVGQTSYREASHDTLTLVPKAGIQYNGIVSYGSENNFINGGIIELGREIPYARGLSLFAGYYGFAPDGDNPFTNGFKTRVEYVVDEAFNVKIPFMRHVTLESSYQYDNVNLGAFTVGARIDIPLGKSSTYSTLQNHMLDYVRFDPHAMQEHIDVTPPDFYKQNGTTVIFDKVATNAELTTALSDDSNVVVIENDIPLTTTETIGNNKYITGQNYEYSSGNVINISGNTVLPTITGTTDSDLFIVGKNNTVRDMNLILNSSAQTPADGAVASSYHALANNGLSVGALDVNNITTNGLIVLNVRDASTDSVINVTNSTFNLSGLTGASGNGASPIEINLHNSSAVVKLNSISNNNIYFLNNVAGTNTYLAGINLNGDGNNAGTFTIGHIDNNTIDFSAGNINNGIYIGSYGSNDIITSVSGNTITFDYSNVSNATGISFNNQGNQKVQAANNNTIKFGDGANVDFGIYFVNYGTQTGTASNNSVTFGNVATQNVYGIYFNNNGSSTQMGVASNNIITFGDNATNYTNGIYFVNYGTQTGTASNNSVTFGSTATNHVYAIYFNNKSAGIQTVTASGNAVNFGDNANNFVYGIHFTNYGTQTGTVSNNSVTIGNAATYHVYGIYINNQNYGQTVTVSGNNVTLGNDATNTVAGIVFGNSGVTQTSSIMGNKVTLGNGATDTVSGINVESYNNGSGRPSVTIVDGLNNNTVIGFTKGDAITINNSIGTMIVNINGTGGTNVPSGNQAIVLATNNDLNASDVTVGNNVTMTD